MYNHCTELSWASAIKTNYGRNEEAQLGRIAV
jgi:hypothetical protein